MSKELQFQRYHSFISESYPTSPWLKKQKHITKLSNVHSALLDSTLIFEVFEDVLKQKTFSGVVKLLEGYKEFLNSTLISLPVNHPSFIGYLIRSSVEQLLKYIHSFTFYETDYTKASKVPFRHLKSELKEFYNNTDIYKKLLRLLEYYGKYSKQIHLHSVENYSGTINYYTNNFFPDMNKIVDDIISVVNLSIEVVCFVIEFDIKQLSSASFLRLKRQLNQDRFSVLNNTVSTI